MKKKSAKKNSPTRKPKTTNRVKYQFPLWLAAAVVILVGVIAYWNSFDAPLVFDDFLTIQNNDFVRFGDVLSFRPFGARSLLYMTFGINYALHEQDVWGYHLVNVTLHLLNGLLILLIALYTFRRIEIEESKARIYAVLAGAFFVCHPIQIQAVTYVSSRSETLSTFFYLLALFVFVRAPSRWIGFGLSLVVGTIMYLGLLSKETVISLPAGLLVYDFLFRSRSSLRELLSRWRFYVTFLVGGTVAGYYLLTGPLRNAVGSAQTGNLTVWYYLLTQSKVIVHYLQLTLFPIGQNLDHDVPPSVSPFEPAVFASLLVIAGLFAIAWFTRLRSPVVAFSIMWFFVTLAPTSSFVPIIDFMFEHRMYLPMAGICLSFPILLDLFGRTIRERIRFRPRLVPVAAGILTALTIGTVMRNEVWRDEVTLWADVVSKSPEKLRGYNALAMSHFRKGEYDQGLRVARQGYERFPDQRGAFADSIGNMYLQLGRYDEAVETFSDAVETEAAKTSPNEDFLSMELNNTGVAYLYKWRLLQGNQQNISVSAFEAEKRRILEPALEAFSQSLEYDSSMRFTTLDSYVNVMYSLGRGDELRLAREAKLAESEDFESRYALGKLGFNADDFETAAAHFEEATKLEPAEHLFWFNYGYSLDQLGRQEDSIEAYTEAILLNPVFIEAHHNVGQLRMLRQEYDAAISNFEEVLRLFPGHVSANLRLAYIYVDINQPEVARQHALTALDTSPNNQEALDLLARIG